MNVLLKSPPAAVEVFKLVYRARKNLEAAPRIIFAVRGGPQNNFRRFHSFLPFRGFTSVFCRFSQLSLFFRCFFAVFHPFSLFLTVFHSFFLSFSIVLLPFFPLLFHGFFSRIFWIPPYWQDRMGSEPKGEGQPPFYPGKKAEPTNSGFRL